jgi:hypothetical protein
MNVIETNAEIPAIELAVGDLLFDPAKTGTHQQRVVVQWVGHHDRRNRTYVAGVEESSRNPVTLAYDDTDTVKVYHRP